MYSVIRDITFNSLRDELISISRSLSNALYKAYRKSSSERELINNFFKEVQASVNRSAKKHTDFRNKSDENTVIFEKELQRPHLTLRLIIKNVDARVFVESYEPIRCLREVADIIFDVYVDVEYKKYRYEKEKLSLIRLKFTQNNRVCPARGERIIAYKHGKRANKGQVLLLSGLADLMGSVFFYGVRRGRNFNLNYVDAKFLEMEFCHSSASYYVNKVILNDTEVAACFPSNILPRVLQISQCNLLDLISAKSRILSLYLNLYLLKRSCSMACMECFSRAEIFLTGLSKCLHGNELKCKEDVSKFIYDYLDVSKFCKRLIILPHGFMNLVLDIFMHKKGRIIQSLINIVNELMRDSNSNNKYKYYNDTVHDFIREEIEFLVKEEGPENTIIIRCEIQGELSSEDIVKL